MRLRIALLLLISPSAIAPPGTAQPPRDVSSAAQNPLVVVPESVGGVGKCRVNLNGTWEFSGGPADGFWKDTSSAGWRPIQVPGEPMMQGFAVQHNVEYGYRTYVTIPLDYAGKRVMVRFNGVYSYARVWVNGEYVRDHHGGFTSWDCDITPLVTPGRTAKLVLGFQDRLEEISFGSGYAKHTIGGILRSVELFALPEHHFQHLSATIRFDSLYRNATLTVEAALNKPVAATLELALFDPFGKRVTPGILRLQIPDTAARISAVIPVVRPLQWSAENPRLYTLRAALVQEGKTTEQTTQRIGFRDVRVRGKNLYVNGMPVRLRGVCRHDIHPRLGRSTTPEQDREDVLLAKAANVNFIRTSHYPPSKEFLDFCDEYGLYVEEEAAVCFVGTHRHEPYQGCGASQSDTAFTDRYRAQLREMIDRDKLHPSVILWSIGNENEYGSNFQASYEDVKRLDTSRPVLFSYPGKVPADRTCYDLLSIHYVDYEGRANQVGIEITDFGHPAIPVLHDEWAHVPCYNTPTLRSDPNVRNFWGESLKRMWDGCFDSDGGAGGAIWGFVDECFMLPDTTVGYGPWGIIDLWRRKKPEFWHTRKAYSPVRVEQTRFPSCRPGDDFVVPVHNRFDHTNMKELQVLLTAGTRTRTIMGPDIPPHAHGSLIVPGEFPRGNEIRVKFILRGAEVDEEVLTLGTAPMALPKSAGVLRIAEVDSQVVAGGDLFRFVFDRRTGLLKEGSVEGERVIVAGPFLHITSRGGKIDWSVDSLVDVTGNRWEPDRVTFQRDRHGLAVSAQGRADSIEVRFTVRVNGNGELKTAFVIPRIPERWREVGVRYVLDQGLNRLSWKRNALWSVYPADHIGRPVGSISKLAPATQQEVYRERPKHPWSWDTRDFTLQGKDPPPGAPAVPVDFRSTKEHILQYSLTDSLSHRGVCVNSDGSVAARAVVDADRSTTLIVLNQWNYANLSWGNYERLSKPESPLRGVVSLQMIWGERPR